MSALAYHTPLFSLSLYLLSSKMKADIQPLDLCCEAITFSLPGEEAGPEKFRTKSGPHGGLMPGPRLLKVLPQDR